MTHRFPPDFLWGAATAAYQIEGAAKDDGRGESIWDRFSHTAGKVYGGHTGDVACDHYHRWEEDIDIMRELNLDAYRFSISWPRILPNGSGEVNEQGIGFYDRLIDGLLDAGIQPHATLNHWDLPQSLEDQGGWPVRSTADAFAEYAGVVASRLGDRLASIATHNEPWVISTLGYETGRFAPGRSSEQEGRDAAHHLLLSHALASRRIKQLVPGTPVGIVLNFNPYDPASSDPLDVALAAQEHARFNRWFIEPLAGRGYPEPDVVNLDWDRSTVLEGDLDLIAGHMDFMGINFYTRGVVRHEHAEQVPTVVRGPDRTGFDWEIYPDGLLDVLRFVHAYGVADRLLITENGAAFPIDPADPTADPQRQAYLAAHVARVAQARDEGIPVDGYFVWSLLDNFEWAHGYSQRFGIVGVDFETLERTPRDSARWYAQLARTGVLAT